MTDFLVNAHIEAGCFAAWCTQGLTAGGAEFRKPVQLASDGLGHFLCQDPLCSLRDRGFCDRILTSTIGLVGRVQLPQLG
jgi:hypothetical protein